MIDEIGKLYLIEINTNPDLSLCSPLLSRLIPQMIENSLRIALDPLFPPPLNQNMNKKVNSIGGYMENNKYQLIYDQSIDYEQVKELLTQFDHKAVGKIVESETEQDHDPEL